jgi:hypothetical protein
VWKRVWTAAAGPEMSPGLAGLHSRSLSGWPEEHQGAGCLAGSHT